MSREEIRVKGYIKRLNNDDYHKNNSGEYHVAEIFHIHDIEELSQSNFLEYILEEK